MKAGSCLLLALLLTGCTSWEEEAQFRVATSPSHTGTASVEATMKRLQYRLAESLPVTSPRVREKQRYTRSGYPKVTVFRLADGHLFIQLWDAGERPFQTKSPYFHQAEESMITALAETYGAANVRKVEHPGAPRD